MINELSNKIISKMDELYAKFNEIIIATNAIDDSMETNFEKHMAELDAFITKPHLNKTPVQNKKRPKRFNSIEEEEENDETWTDKSRSTILSFSTEHEEQSRASLRPVRTARTKANLQLKEPSSKSKMRRVDNNLTVKVERVSVAPKENLENNLNVTNIIKTQELEKKRKSDEGFVTDESKKRSDSIEIIPQPLEKIEVVSEDDSDTGKMPPPKLPPPVKTRKPRTKTRAAATIKQEPVDDNQSSEKVKRSTRSKQKKKVVSDEETEVLKPPKDSNSKIIDSIAEIVVKTEKISMDNKKKPEVVVSPAKSDYSVYEDAINDEAQLKPIIAVTKMNDSFIARILDQENNEEENGTFAVPKIHDGTFAVPSVQDGTFAIPSPNLPVAQSPNDLVNGTFISGSHQDIVNGTFAIPSSSNMNDETYSVKAKSEPFNSSIMTDDNSQINEEYIPDSPPPPVKKIPSKLKKNELFNPCLQSPIKSKIEAFEKAAIGSPMQSRTRAMLSSQLKSGKAVTTTPVGSQATRIRKPSATTPSSQSSLLNSKPVSASASKLAHVQKKAMGAAPKAQSLSREPSVDRSAAASAQEKRKKREEKQRLAQIQRELMEKEKREQAERLLKDKEEKHRKMIMEKEEKMRLELAKKAKKMEEFEKRRQQEESNQKLLMDQKREELAKLEQQKMDREQAELIKLAHAKETYDKSLHKQMYQQKIQQQIQKQQKAQEYTFEMINTDDSTDDESDKNKKTKRPPLPSWCSREERRLGLDMQSNISSKVIDDFFSVAPMTPDLREIFPAIDSRKLKRNSSAVWRTPPRYSQMPKY